MTLEKTRVSRADIFGHLDRLLEGGARAVVAQTVQQVQSGDGHAALRTLQSYDAMMGGMGLQNFKGRKLPGAYRALSYVAMVLRRSEPEEFSRDLVTRSCWHVEAVLKRIVRLNLFESTRADRIPLGTLVRKFKKRLPPTLYTDLDWLAQIGNSAKHEHDFGEDPLPDPEHFFDLDEAVAIYLIARHLVVQMQKHFDLSIADLARERKRA